MRLALYRWEQREPAARTIAQLEELGYDDLQLAGDLNRYDPGEVVDALARHGRKVRGGVADMFGDRDLAHPDAGARAQTVAYLCQLVDLVAAVGGLTVTMVPVAIGRVEPVADAATEWSRCVEGMRAVGNHAGERGIRIAVEALNRFETLLIQRADQGLELADAVGLPNVGVCLDTFHMNIEEPDPVAALRLAAPRLFEVHVGETTRGVPGSGQLDWPEILRTVREVGYRGPLTLETVPAPERVPGRSELPSDDDIARAAARSLRAILGS